MNIIVRGLIPLDLAGVVGCGTGREIHRLHSAAAFLRQLVRINSREDGGLGRSAAKAAQGRLGHSTIAMTSTPMGICSGRGRTTQELGAAERSSWGTCDIDATWKKHN